MEDRKIGVGINLKVLEILSKYLAKPYALEAAKEIQIQIYDEKQDVKEAVIRELKAVAEPQFTVPGAEKLPANTIGLLDEKYDYKKILHTDPKDIEWLGIPKNYIQ